MASGGTVDIFVALEGAGKVQQSLNALGQGATSTGQKFTAAGDALSTSSNLMASSVGTVVSSVGTLSQGITGLTTATTTAGAGFTAMLGPIAAIGTAVVGVALAIRQFVSTSDDMETRLEALKAAAAEYTSVMEGLADENIVLTDAERQRIKGLTRESKFLTEYIQKVREGEGVAGQRLQRYQREYVAAQRAVEQIQRLQYSEAAYLELSREERRRLARATAALEREEDKLRTTEERAMQLRREQANLLEQIREERGRAALEAQAEAARKQQEQAAQALQNMRALQGRFESESLRLSADSLSDRLYLLRVELAERARAIEASAVDEQQKAETLFAAEQSFAAKRRALRRAASRQRQAQRAQEAAAEMAAERSLFQDRQRLREAEIRLEGDGFEQQRQLIELRFETAQQMAQNQIQTQTILLNKRRELQALEEKQEADRRRAEMQRIEALQRSLELTRQEATALRDLSNIDMTQITGAMQSFGQGLVFASLAAIQSGDSFKAAVGEALKAIALQAGVEAIMQTAKGVAASFLSPTEATKHFQAAALFGTAAALAGSAGSALGSGGGGGGGGGRTSPTGTAQTARQVDRDDREEPGGVTINVNMGQAVIYDTKAAAERAFADRVVSAINSPRRGAVRLRRS